MRTFGKCGTVGEWHMGKREREEIKRGWGKGNGVKAVKELSPFGQPKRQGNTVKKKSGRGQPETIIRTGSPPAPKAGLKRRRSIG